jgi:serine/threonine protein kinase
MLPARAHLDAYYLLRSCIKQPENLLVDLRCDPPVLKVCDFGASRHILELNSDNTTSTGTNK